MSTFDVADTLVSLCRQGRFLESGDALWGDDVVSVEPFTGDMATLKGREALRAKGEWWSGAHEVHAVTVSDPYVCGESFLVRFTFDLTVKETGERRTLDEFGVYDVKDGKVVAERFFVPKGYFGG